MPGPPTLPRLRPAEPPTRRLHREPESTAPAKAPDLTVNKVIAGAGAAATSAVLGSYFGAAGTVTGAALGSVASTIATVIYQRSLDRTRDTLVARIRVTPGRRTDVAEPVVGLPLQRVAPDAETVRLRVEPDVARPRRRRTWLWIAATVLVFAIGLLTVTGLEWAKGSTLTTGETGTSVGRVFDGDHGAPAPAQEPEETQDPEPSTSPEPTTEPTEEPTPSDSPESGATDEPDAASGERSSEGNRDDESDTTRPRLFPTPLFPTP